MSTPKPRKMPAAIKRAWVKALRSGEYEQGCGALYEGGKYCCLGVLYRLVKKRNPRVDAALLPDPVLRQCALTEGQQHAFAHRNDGTAGFSRRSFTQIATYIEEHL